MNKIYDLKISSLLCYSTLWILTETDKVHFIPCYERIIPNFSDNKPVLPEKSDIIVNI